METHLAYLAKQTHTTTRQTAECLLIPLPTTRQTVPDSQLFFHP